MPSNSHPLIGVTTYRTKSDGISRISISEAYIAALSLEGASPITIPLGISKPALDRILSRLDGLLFSGGGDIHPDTYGSQMHPLVNEVDRDRDQIELYLLNQALEKKLPFLGICRGLQLINVGMGGTLYEHILDQHAGSLQHQYYPDWPRDYLAHDVKIEEDSRLDRLLTTAHFEVNSLHHQGVKRLAPGLRPSAYAPDGIVEALELPDYPFGLAVQWHPESLPDEKETRMLFSAFIEACKPTLD